MVCCGTAILGCAHLCLLSCCMVYEIHTDFGPQCPISHDLLPCIVHDMFTSLIRCVEAYFGRGLTVARGATGGFGGGDDSGGGFRQTFEDTIFVSGMPPESTSEEIADFFGSIGRIKVS